MLRGGLQAALLRCQEELMQRGAGSPMKQAGDLWEDAASASCPHFQKEAMCVWLHTGCALATPSPSAVAKGLLAASAGSGPAAVGRPPLAVSSASLSSHDSRLSMGPSSMPASQTSLNVLQRAAKAEQTSSRQTEEQERVARDYSAATCQAFSC